MSEHWLVVGSPDNWRTAFEHGNIWGLKETQRHLWESLREGHSLVFYATKPVGGIIGHGSVRTKFRQNQPLWPQELREGRVIWPLRFEFDVHYCLAPAQWTSGKLVSKDLMPRAGFQRLSQDTGRLLLAALQALRHPDSVPREVTVAETRAAFRAGSEALPETLPSHGEVQEALVEIGRLQSFIAESEYQCDIGRLDVVWRRVQQSVPTYVFEIQVGGNLYQALAKLKHAFDLWNSHVFLVSSKEDFSRVDQLLSGTFHEIHHRMKLIDCLQVRELLARKQGYRNLEREVGIL